MFKKSALVAIRETIDTGEWMDVSSISLGTSLNSREIVKWQCAQDDNACGAGWAKANPVKRIIQVTITEVDPLET
jgi:hypothetical protein